MRGILTHAILDRWIDRTFHLPHPPTTLSPGTFNSLSVIFRALLNSLRFPKACTVVGCNRVFFFLSGLGKAEDALRLVERLRNNVFLGNNRWTTPPESVVEAGVPAVERYLLDVQAAKETGDDLTLLRRLKVILVGSAAAGKTRCALMTTAFPAATRHGISCLQG